MSERRVMAHCAVPIDGYSSGPDGPEHHTWPHEHAMRPLRRIPWLVAFARGSRPPEPVVPLASPVPAVRHTQDRVPELSL